MSVSLICLVLNLCKIHVLLWLLLLGVCSCLLVSSTVNCQNGILMWSKILITWPLGASRLPGVMSCALLRRFQLPFCFNTNVLCERLCYLFSSLFVEVHVHYKSKQQMCELFSLHSDAICCTGWPQSSLTPALISHIF